MDQEIKQRWVAALRSGEYQQGTDYLCNDGKFCCLGVLSEIAVQDGVIDAPEEIESPSGGKIRGLAYDGDRHHLSQTVAKWAGMPEEHHDWTEQIYYDVDPSVTLSNGDEKCLSELNDAGWTFAEIADVIEEKL